ncbi:hypothetical protein N8797_01285 [Pontimonas sp.]|nr:hypothetical protein [Pontimonas sp.]
MTDVFYQDASWPRAGDKEKVENDIPGLAQRLMQVATTIETRLGGTGGI